jgi:hypothetical protein
MMIYLSKMVIFHSYVMCIYIYMYGTPPPRHSRTYLIHIMQVLGEVACVDGAINGGSFIVLSID